MSVFTRILGTGIFGILLAVIVASIAVVCGNFHHSNQVLENRYEIFRSQIIAAENAHINWLCTIYHALLTKNPDLNIQTDGKLCVFGKWYYSEGKEIVEYLDPEIKKEFEGIENDHLKVHDSGSALIKRWNTGDFQPAVSHFSQEIISLANGLLAKLAALNQHSLAYIDEVERRGNRILRIQYILTIIVLTAGMTVLIPFAYFTAKGIVQPLNKGVALAKDIESGHVSGRLHLQRKDEIGVLADALDHAAQMIEIRATLARSIAQGDLTQEVVIASGRDSFGEALSVMTSSLRESIGILTKISGDVGNNAAQLAAASENLSYAAQKDAAQIAGMTDQIREVAGQTAENADLAKEAADTAHSARDAAKTGQDNVTKMLQSMRDITKESQEIKNVIRVIDGIACQTNLLALNAAVEAARAGTYGKGFAVVAEEVRNLAVRSAKSAQETAAMIEQTIRQVECGSQTANRTAESLTHIAEEVSKVNDLISRISGNAVSQSERLNQLSSEIGELNAGTAAKSANAEETASMAGELSGSAKQVQGIAGRFRI
ncbi:MAG: methyl-accepting chemotaxis protein [Planctomycetaceae bacterium]|jgi:methyl-accepting chemotaxis protein|nr:methyl-accepting chemotaxis protein [Planctomycetaceae bacterium]